MYARLCLGLAISVALAAIGCSKHGSPPTSQRTQAHIDPCALLSKQDIEALQHSPITETKSSERTDGDFRMAQCFYTATEFNKSVNVVVIEKQETRKRTPKDFWDETFLHAGGEKEKEEHEREEEKERTPPKKIEGLGDDAYWSSNRFGGMLYVLKGDAFFSISVGGADTEQVKLEKCKTLAQKALERM